MFRLWEHETDQRRPRQDGDDLNDVGILVTFAPSKALGCGYGSQSWYFSIMDWIIKVFIHAFPARMLMALPAIPVRVMIEIAACRSISSFARRVSGMVSVGLNAKLVVNARYR